MLVMWVVVDCVVDVSIPVSWGNSSQLLLSWLTDSAAPCSHASVFAVGTTTHFVESRHELALFSHTKLLHKLENRILAKAFSQCF